MTIKFWLPLKNVLLKHRKHFNPKNNIWPKSRSCPFNIFVGIHQHILCLKHDNLNNSSLWCRWNKRRSVIRILHGLLNFLKEQFFISTVGIIVIRWTNIHVYRTGFRYTAVLHSVTSLGVKSQTPPNFSRRTPWRHKNKQLWSVERKPRQLSLDR